MMAPQATAQSRRAATSDAAQRMLAVQVALDRAGFSPGVIDGSRGKNTEAARRAYEASRAPARDEGKGTATPDEAAIEPLATYAISAEDAVGPFVGEIPTDMMEKSKLQELGYSSLLEMLAERFHTTPALLQRLNPGVAFVQGDVITVPNVEAFRPPVGKANTQQAAAAREPVTVIVTDRTKSLEVQNAAGQTIFFAPVTVGSLRDPLPVGEWKVNGVSENPTFNYNPDLFWDAESSHAKAKIAAGPNSPVGVVWIDLSKEHYGIHGTPEPSRIGYTESHGCIRLTNWDAMRLAALVGPRTKVVLR